MSTAPQPVVPASSVEPEVVEAKPSLAVAVAAVSLGGGVVLVDDRPLGDDDLLFLHPQESA